MSSTVETQITRPVIFSAPMVRAILDGRKTQTRRIVGSLESKSHQDVYQLAVLDFFAGDGKLYAHFTDGAHGVACPYGVAGDRLWVRETWRTRLEWNDCSPSGLPISPTATGGDTNDPDDWDWLREQFIQYEVCPQDNGTLHGKLRPSIHMPRWASRITLEITKVRVERLQDISYKDCEAEGLIHGARAMWSCPGTDEIFREGYLGYKWLWDSLHGKGAWEKNPWVWVLEFKRVLCGNITESDSGSGNPKSASPATSLRVTDAEVRDKRDVI